jgi:hypothetical protein
MATQTIEVEVWVLVDASGDYAVAKDAAAAVEAYEGEVQALTESGGHRLVKLTVKVPLPATVELVGEVPPDGESATMTVK